MSENARNNKNKIYMSLEDAIYSEDAVIMVSAPWDSEVFYHDGYDDQSISIYVQNNPTNPQPHCIAEAFFVKASQGENYTSWLSQLEIYVATKTKFALSPPRGITLDGSVQ